MARYRVLSWRGIPTQLKMFPESERPYSVALSEWFMQEVDRVAMRDGLVGSDEYLEGFEWSEDLERPGSPSEVADALVAEIEGEWVPASRRQEGEEQA
jgi:hypothetical protein